MKTLLIAISFLIYGCTPSATSTLQKSAQDSRLSASLGHSDASESIPINIQCIQVFTGKGEVNATPCFSRQGELSIDRELLK